MKTIINVIISLFIAHFLNDLILTNTSVSVPFSTEVGFFIILFLISFVAIVFRKYVFKIMKWTVLLIIFAFLGDDGRW